MERRYGSRCGLWLIAALASAASAAGCKRPAAAGTDGGAAAIVVTDDLGRRIGLPHPARRIASLAPGHTETLFALGCGGRIVLRDRASDHPPSVAKLPAVDPFRAAPDHLVGYRPDLTLLSHHDPGRLAALERLGLKVAVLDPPTIDRVLVNIVTVGRLCGAGLAAGRLAGDLRRRLARVTRRVRDKRRPRVYIEVDGADPARPWTAGPRSFVGHLVRLAGGDNVVTGTRQRYLQVGAETIVRADPEVILLTGTARSSAGLAGAGLARLRRRRGWQELAAVRAGRVIDRIDPDLLSRPGPRLVDGLEALALALHAAPPRAGAGR